jgi:hypothetical protein
VQCGFAIKIRADDSELVRSIWRALRFPGNIYPVSTRRYQYTWDTVRRHDSILLSVKGLGELTRYIIPFFDLYPLHGTKRRNYEIWKQVVEMMERGEHLTLEGVERVQALKDSMNRYQGQDELDELAHDSDEQLGADP